MVGNQEGRAPSERAMTTSTVPITLRDQKEVRSVGPCNRPTTKATYLGTIYSLCSVHYPNIRRGDPIQRERQIDCDCAAG